MAPKIHYYVASTDPVSVIEVLPPICYHSVAAIKLVQVVFYLACDSSAVNILVLKCVAQVQGPNSFYILLNHGLMQGFTNWPHVRGRGKRMKVKIKYTYM